MTETRTLEFENARALQSLYANDIKLLKNLEDSLGVRVTTREGWVKMEGEPEKLDRAQRVFDQLEEARKRGVDIQKREFNYALNSVSEERSDNLSDAISARIVTSSRKAPVIARTVGQKNYVEAIEKHDVVFAIGPAGTGKTYLAVAMAVAALKKEQVSRIMLLTRIGMNSKCVVTGDVTQIDLPANKRSGLVEALQALKAVPGIAMSYFTDRDVVRHPLVRAIINAYQQHRTPSGRK